MSHLDEHGFSYTGRNPVIDELVNFYGLKELANHPPKRSMQLTWGFYTSLFATPLDGNVTSAIVRGVKVKFSPEAIAAKFKIPLGDPEQCWYRKRTRPSNEKSYTNEHYLLNLLSKSHERRWHRKNSCALKKASLKDGVKLLAYFVS